MVLGLSAASTSYLSGFGAFSRAARAGLVNKGETANAPMWDPCQP